MPQHRPSRKLRVLTLAAMTLVGTIQPVFAQETAGAATAPPTVSLGKSPKIVAYQLKRLDNAKLLTVERKTDDPKYVPVYEAILVRAGMERKFRQEAAESLATLNKSDAVVEILGGIGKAETDDAGTRGELVGLLLTQKPEVLAKQKPAIESLATAESSGTSLKEAAYAALVVADGKPDAIWERASKSPGALPALLGSVGILPDAKLKAAFRPLVEPLVDQSPDDATRAAAAEALGAIPGDEAKSFAKLASIVSSAQGDVRAAAVRSLRRIPADKWPKDQLAPLAQSIVKTVGDTPAADRTTPALIETIQLGEELAAAMPKEQSTPVRKALRELGVRTILVRAVKEQMAYDLRYFVVQAGKPVQIVLDNPDSMPHNLIITAPGAIQEIGIAGGAMQPPTDPAAKPFVPDDARVLHATGLAQPGQAEKLSFDAPKEPGEYGYVCTYPGHWMRMYGVMLVVPDLDAYDANPTIPADPFTKKPFESAKISTTAPPHASHAH